MTHIQRAEIEILLEEALDAVIHLIETFTPEAFNAKPENGGWTAGQVAEHMRQSFGVAKVLHGETKPAQRAPDANIPKLKSIFLDFETKYNAPDFLIPAEKWYDPAEMAREVEAAKASVLHDARTLDLSPTCFNDIFEDHSRLEWLHFVVVHTQRHTRQMRKRRV